jgi:hypothetical protein
MDKEFNVWVRETDFREIFRFEQESSWMMEKTAYENDFFSGSVILRGPNLEIEYRPRRGDFEIETNAPCTGLNYNSIPGSVISEFFKACGIV